MRNLGRVQYPPREPPRPKTAVSSDDNLHSTLDLLYLIIQAHASFTAAISSYNYNVALGRFISHSRNLSHISLPPFFKFILPTHSSIPFYSSHTVSPASLYIYTSTNTSTSALSLAQAALSISDTFISASLGLRCLFVGTSTVFRVLISGASNSLGFRSWI